MKLRTIFLSCILSLPLVVTAETANYPDRATDLMACVLGEKLSEALCQPIMLQSCTGAIGSHRAPLLPDVPTLAEAGMEGVEAHVWLGALAPRETAQGILDKLGSEIRRILETDAGIRQIFHDNGFEIIANDSSEFSAQISQEQVQWKELMATVELQAQ